jgi:hypothetical protein
MSNVEQITAIKCNTLAQIAAVSAEQKPSYTDNGQSFRWTEYIEHLERRVAWCNQMLAVEDPFEVETRGFVE